MLKAIERLRDMHKDARKDVERTQVDIGHAEERLRWHREELQHARDRAADSEAALIALGASVLTEAI